MTESGRPELTAEELRRWEEHGATWRAVALDEDGATVELCTCSGEPVDRLRGSSAALLAFVRSRQGASGG